MFITELTHSVRWLRWWWLKRYRSSETFSNDRGGRRGRGFSGDEDAKDGYHEETDAKDGADGGNDANRDDDGSDCDFLAQPGGALPWPTGSGVIFSAVS